MKMLLYLDANVILARYVPEEPQHNSAKKLLAGIEEGNHSAITSDLTLVEVTSTVSRAYERFHNNSETSRREDIAAAYLRRVLSIRNLDFISLGGDISLDIGGRVRKIPALFAVAMEIGSRSGLKTLDNIHLAAASIASKVYERRIDCFVTLDDDILKHQKGIDELTGISAISPKEASEQ